MKRALAIVGLIGVAVVALGISTHAAAGAAPHAANECLGCGLCALLVSLLH